MKSVNGKQILAIGNFPTGSEQLLEAMSAYKRHGGDCFDCTEEEIKKGRANGCFANTYSPRHVLPAINMGEVFFAYDDPLGGYDLIAFSGNQSQIRKTIDDFFSIDSPYGPGFVFQKTVDG